MSGTNSTPEPALGFDHVPFRRIVEQSLADINVAPEVMKNYRRRFRGEVQTIHYFTKEPRRDGKLVHLDLHASRVVFRGRPALAGVALDVTQRVNAQ